MLRRRMIALTVVGMAFLAGQTTVASPAVETPVKAPFDRAFIDAMVPHHRSAIEMTHLAQRYGLSEPSLISVARDILAAQRREIATMQSWRKRWYGSAKIDPAGADELGLSEHELGMDHDLGELRRAKDVNKAFALMIIAHHTDAIRMARLAAQNAKHRELKVLARQIINVQQREVRLIQPFASGKHKH